MNLLFALIAGLLFGLGVTISGMTDPAKVLGFFDITGQWDPSLIMVMGGGLTLTFIGYRFILKRAAPACDTTFHVPTNSKIDGRLIMGAGLFGIGWGLVGFCPGPAIAALTFGDSRVWVFFVGLFIGQFIWKKLEQGFSGNRQAAE